MTDLLSGLLDSNEEKPRDRTLALAMLLRHLADMLSENPSIKDEREEREQEIRVRPRVEPLGGS